MTQLVSTEGYLPGQVMATCLRRIRWRHASLEGSQTRARVLGGIERRWRPEALF